MCERADECRPLRDSAWGDNLTGDASLTTKHPIRVEMVLSTANVDPMTGYEVEKLDPSALDRVSAYGTEASGTTQTGFTANPTTFDSPGVWDSLGSFTITNGTTTVSSGSAEINATGKVVYGYNFSAPTPGTYTITFTAPDVSITSADGGTVSENQHSVTLPITVGSGSGGGNGGGPGLRAAGVVDGSEVLVYGATGAIGPSAVQIIKSLGGHVTAVCSSEHVELVAGLGADRVVDRTTTDFTADDRRYDVVLDPVGECSFRQCRKLLKPQGIWTSTDLGPLSQNLLLVLATRLSRGRRVLFPFPTIDQAMVEDLERLVEARQFAPVIDRTYPLEEIVEAYRYVEASGPSGHFWLGASD